MARMIFLGFLLLSGAVSAQDLLKWCPNLVKDILNCTDTYIKSLANNNKISGTSLATNPFAIASDTGTFCTSSVIEPLKHVFDCMYTKMRSCIPIDYHKTLSDIGKMKEGLEYLCKNGQDIDFACFTSKLDESIQCGKNKLLGQTFKTDTPDGLLEFVCRNNEAGIACYKEVLGSCPKKTAEVLSTLLGYYTPLACKAPAALGSSLLLIIFALFLHHLLR